MARVDACEGHTVTPERRGDQVHRGEQGFGIRVAIQQLAGAVVREGVIGFELAPAPVGQPGDAAAAVVGEAASVISPSSCSVPR